VRRSKRDAHPSHPARFACRGHPRSGAAAAQVTIKLIAINDFHGYIEPSETFALPDPADPQKTVREPVGGAAYLATAIAGLKAENRRNVVVGAGDMVGASPLDSALFHDEPTIQALSTMGLEYTSVGNHEFDEGKAELLRKQRGGCRPAGKSAPTRACSARRSPVRSTAISLPT